MSNFILKNIVVVALLVWAVYEWKWRGDESAGLTLLILAGIGLAFNTFFYLRSRKRAQSIK